jgi:WD40 repeat protein
MIATGSRDFNVRIWEYEKFRMLFELRAHEEEVTMVKFLKPLPLLLTADSKGILYVWLIPGPWVQFDPRDADEPKCLLKWTNKHSMESDVPISAVDCHFNPVDKTLLLLIGDEKGYVKVSDITCCVRHYNLDQVILDTKDGRRNPKFKAMN